MTGSGKALAVRAEAAAGAVGLVLLILGATVNVLLVPGCVRQLVTAAGSTHLTGLDDEQTLEIAEAVRRFVTDERAPELPSRIDGMRAFDEAAVSHLTDVRDLIIGVRRLTVALLGSVLIWAILRGRSPSGRGAVASACVWASRALLAGVLMAAPAAAANFDMFFAWFHRLFFEEGTWVFPAGDLLVQVFPLRFWVLAGFSWALLIIVSCVLLRWIGARSGFRRGTYGV